MAEPPASTPLTAIALNCSLKKSSGEPSSTDQMIGLIVGELKKQGVEFSETIRVAPCRPRSMYRAETRSLPTAVSPSFSLDPFGRSVVWT